MKATITIKEKRIKHNDPNAAGFKDGWWWRVVYDDPDMQPVESGAATEDEALSAATLAAGSAQIKRR